jgi:PAS domain S-box-containing protein
LGVEEHPGQNGDWAAADGVVVLDRDCLVMGANQAARLVLGLELSPGSRLELEELFQGPCAGPARAALEQVLGGGEACEGRAAQLQTPYPQPVECLYGLSPLLGRFGEVTGAILTIRNLALNLLTEEPGEAGRLPPHLPRLGYRALFENLAEGVFTINLHWRITSFNQRASQITGYRREEVLGRFCWDIFRSDLCETGCPLRTTLDTGVVRMDQDVRMLSKEGRSITVLTNTSAVRDGAGKVVGAVESFRLLSQEGAPAPEGQESREYPEIVGASPALGEVLKLLPEVAQSEANVLIVGESGTGKELFARAIHDSSPRREAPFAAVNCSALAETLLESELFGHERAAFTGAVRSKAGRFELAKGGTLFLDEIGDLKPELQVKLLRVLEQRVFERVGGSRLIPLDARLVAATNQDLTQALRQGRFREDLYYRLRTVPLYIPPLRQRPGDIRPLVEHFIRRFNQKTGKAVRAVDPKALAVLESHHWPGNVRELQRAIEYAFVFVKGPMIFAHHLPALDSREPAPAAPPAAVDREQGDPRRSVESALERAGGRRADAARLLGVSRTTLWRRMKELGLA